MIEKFKEHLKKSFSNGPKAKIIFGLLICVVFATAVIISMKKTIVINIDGEEATYTTYKGTVKDVLKEQNLDINEKDKVQPSLDSKISENETISVKSAVPVNVTIAGEGREILTAENTIGEMLDAEKDELNKEGLEYKDTDIVSPSREEPITKDMDIQVVNVLEEEVTESEDIPYETETHVDYDQLDNYREVTTQGVVGKKDVTYKVVKHNDEVVAKLKVSEKPVTDPVNETVTVGGSKLKIDRNGTAYKSKKTLTVQATAYTGDKRTATGRIPSYNPGGISTIAVDPRLIPLGSLVEVEGYGRAIASDTGGAIKGNIIDVFLDSQSACNSWGRKYNVEVNIISYPGEW